MNLSTLYNKLGVDVDEDSISYNEIVLSLTYIEQNPEILDNVQWVDQAERTLYENGIQELKNTYKQKKFINPVQDVLDSTARSHGYDNIISACTYAIARGRFQAEGMKFAEWRTDVWDYCYTELEKVTNGIRTEPTVEELISELPQLNI